MRIRQITCLLAVFASCCVVISCDVSSHRTSATTQSQEIITTAIKSNKADRSKLLDALSLSSLDLTRTKSIDDFVYEAKYLPHLQQLLSSGDTTLLNGMPTSKFLNELDNYENLYAFCFTIENKKYKSELLRYGLQSADEYAHRVSYYSFYCNQDVYLVADGKDTLKAAFVNFERTFDISPRLNLTFVFEKKGLPPVNRFNFVFNDAVFENGKLNFEFNYKSISVFDSHEIKKLIR